MLAADVSAPTVVETVLCNKIVVLVLMFVDHTVIDFFIVFD